MKYFILVLFTLILSIEAQYTLTIPCKNDETCANILKLQEISKCIKGACMCTNNTTKSFQYCQNKDIIVNSKQRAVRRNCLQDEDCNHIEGAMCYENHIDKSKKICDCPANMIISENKQKCLTIASEHLSTCIESRQCTAGLDGAECVEGKCHCRAKFHFASSSKRCIPIKVYGETCNKEEDICFKLDSSNGVNNLRCSDQHICKCLENYVYVDDLCQFSDASRTVFQISLIMIMVAVTIKMF